MDYRIEMRRLTGRVRRVLCRSERVHMWLLERDLAASTRRYYSDVAEAMKTGGDIEEVQSRHAFEDNYMTEELEGIRTGRHVRRARRLRISLPSPRPNSLDPADGDENWWFGMIMGDWCLTAAGEARLRTSIREEEKASRESAAFWFGIWTTLIGVTAGLVGALTGLIAVWGRG